MEKNVYMKEEKLFMAFKMFDLDGNGKISANDLKEVLGSIIKKIVICKLEDENFKYVNSNFWK